MAPSGRGLREAVEENALQQSYTKLKIPPAPFVTLCVPPSSRRKANIDFQLL